jgi:peptidoglycan/LPS O-acetylase OafA/YrhL
MPARVTAVSVTLISGVALWWLSVHAFSFDANGWVSYMSPYSRVFEFASGCALAHAYSRGYRLGRKTAVAAVGWIAFFALRGFTGNAALAAFMLHVGLLLPIAALIYAVATSNSFGWLRHKFVLRMGEASYSMYLLHLIVAERLASSIHLADIEPNWVNAIISFTIAVAAIAGLSLASYRTIEVPAQRMLRRLLTGRMHPTIVHGGTGYSR